eukprot:g4079.t1
MASPKPAAGSDGQKVETREETKLRVVTAFKRFTEKNPFWKRALQNFTDKYAPEFDGEEEHKLRYTELFGEYAKLMETSISLFIRKTKGCDERLLAEAITDGTVDGMEELAEMLMANGDFEAFVKMMKAKRLAGLRSGLGSWSSGGSGGGEPAGK